MFSRDKRGAEMGKTPKNWARKYDRLVAQGVPQSRMVGKWWMSKQQRTRVQDPDSGLWLTRDGHGCCGCGQHKNHHPIEPSEYLD
jgi:hypothetical protein